jgi:hypothetical protein
MRAAAWSLIALASCSPHASRYTALLASPDRVTLLGPSHSRAVTVLGRLPSGELEAVPPQMLQATASDPRIVAVHTGRIRALQSGAAEVAIGDGELRTTIEVEVLSHPAPFIQSIVDQHRGKGDGFGRDRLPDVILGPPQGGGENQGSLDVLSLGIGGSITVSFAPLRIYDGPGPDLIVFENPFRIAGTDQVYAEPGIVAVSGDGSSWSEYACDARVPPYAGCAGVHPVIAGPLAPDVDPTDPDAAGGDPFDLDGHLPLAQLVRVTDAGTGTVTGNTSGFDLDAMAIVHALPEDAEMIEPSTTRIRVARGKTQAVPRFDALLSSGERIEGVCVKLSLSPNGAAALDGAILSGLDVLGTSTLTALAGALRAQVMIEVQP